MKKLLSICLSLGLLCLVVFALTACGAGTDGERTITDMGGYEVVIPEKIERVACGSNPGVDLMVAFGASDTLIAVHKTVPNNVWFDYFYPESENLMLIDSYEPEAESLYAMEADIVFLPDPNVCKALREKGVTAVCLRVYNTEEVKTAAALLGEIFGGQVKEKSEMWLKDFDDSIADIQSRLEDVPVDDRPSVYEIIGDKYKGLYRTNYGDTQAWLKYGGGRIATEPFAGATWGNMPTDEAILETKPDYVLISGMYWEQLKEEIYADPKWATIPAIENERVYSIPIACTSWNNYSTCYPLMNYYVFTVLYPERVDFSLIDKTREFYLKYYGIEFSDTELTYMLQTKGPSGERLCN